MATWLKPSALMTDICGCVNEGIEKQIPFILDPPLLHPLEIWNERQIYVEESMTMVITQYAQIFVYRLYHRKEHLS